MEGKAPIIGLVIGFILTTVAATPLALAIAAMSHGATANGWLTLVAAVIWLVMIVAYRSISAAQERKWRQLVEAELVDVRKARLESCKSFQERMHDQNAILARIIEISRSTLDDGITDPQCTLGNIQLVESHARDAQTLIEEAILEVRLETGDWRQAIDVVDLRTEIADVVGRFSSPGITTVGARLFARTNAAIFRVVLRNLIAAAISCGADEVDVSITRDRDTVTCSVSDNGARGTSEQPSGTSPTAHSLSHTLGTEIVYTHLMNRTQATFGLPAAEPPQSLLEGAIPLDVLGDRSPQPDNGTTTGTARPPRTPVGKITFPVTVTEWDRRESVAARRKGQPITR